MQLSRARIFISDRKWIIGVLLVSLVLRWILVLRGGQYYISDETRYEVSRNAAGFLLHGQGTEALKQFFISPEHLGFKVAGLLPALLEHVMGPSLVLPAAFFSLFSVFNLYLIFLLSKRSHAFADEPLYALLLASSCHSLLYYSRHLFPYDMALSFGLLAVYTALAPNQTVRGSLACGLCAFLCFITYNGYWSLAVFAMLVNLLANRVDLATLLQKIVFMTTGFLAPVALLAAAMLWSGTNIISAYRRFASSITQGSFEEGWSLPFEYFWHAEHTWILILGILSLIAIVSHLKELKRDVMLWAGGILFIYICLLIPSVLLQYFVVYGRLARQMLPFVILLAARGLAGVENRSASGRKAVLLILAFLFIQAAWNFTSSYNLSFPRDFAAKAQVQYPGFEFSSKRLAFGAPEVCQNNGYIIENAKYFVTPPEIVPRIQGQLLLSAPHPVNFLPYQYEGYPPEIRKIFRSLQLEMSFYKIDEQMMSETDLDWSSMRNCMVRENE